ncbi:AraC family transcriptional regulator [Mycobacterium sp. Aquia_216]|uniref:AraC family transcriptional regulator n=1 Tax=Mycobacterium sp. Aquia_216 TaxID=2991729 RepID=UPI00227B3D13|nr:AraC family transcriptional regulator [Mycobacterium sp. Aquia_216]WAJ43633.1 AraC family transcriptional regulator [Mycobacterium sp. Aquia_216]
MRRDDDCRGSEKRELLATHRRIHTSDIDELCETVGQVLNSHRAHCYPCERTEPTSFNSASIESVAFSYITYGASMRVRPEPPESFFVVLIPRAGRASVRGGGIEIQSDAQCAAILDPDMDVDMYFEGGTEQIMLRLDRDKLENQLDRMLGRPGGQRLRFDSCVDMTTPAARSWLSTLQMVCRDLDGPQGLSHAALRHHTEQLVMSQTLTAITHSCSTELDALGAGAPATPRLIRRADQLIRDHAHEALTVHDLAEAVGISVRSLQDGFRRHLRTTPTARLRQARLDGVHAELLAADPAHHTVSRLALGWGFAHFGRFSSTYRATFGESPSQTLRR